MITALFPKVFSGACTCTTVLMLSVRLLQTEPSSEDALLSSSAIRIATGTDLLVAVNSDDGNAVAGILHGLPKGEIERKDSVSLQRSNLVVTISRW
jgi:hypothetical protein